MLQILDWSPKPEITKICTETHYKILASDWSISRVGLDFNKSDALDFRNDSQAPILLSSAFDDGS